MKTVAQLIDSPAVDSLAADSPASLHSSPVGDPPGIDSPASPRATDSPAMARRAAGTAAQTMDAPASLRSSAAADKRATTLRVVIPGGSGHLGHLLARHFHSQGHKITVLSRTGAVAPWRTVSWDGLSLDDWVRELEGADAVINLCGRSVNCRYNSGNRREIVESRVGTTHLIGEAIGEFARPPRVWINASTATIYRHAMDRAMDEVSGEIGGRERDTPSAWHFSIAVATEWEQAFFAAKTPATRKVALRSAIVMSPEAGSAFEILSRLVRSGLGGRAGSGEQFVSWVHHQDFVRAVEHVVAHEELQGPINVAAPNPLPNAEFMATLRDAWGKSVGLPAPAWLLEIGAIFLRTETELILKSRRVVPGRLVESGFKFDFPEWADAARDIVKRYRVARKADERGGAY